jgi:hypothetical protein
MGSLLRFETLLHRERAAAIAADLDALESIAIEKQEALDELTDDTIDDELLDRIVTQARSNGRLLRHLVDLHRALVGGAEPVYGARGDLRAETDPGARLRRPA